MVNNNLGIKIFCLGCLLFACNAEKDAENPGLREHAVNNIQMFLSAEDTLFLGRPTSIKAVSDGLFIVDEGHYQIAKVDYEGNHLFSFGKRGRGPGEFQSITGFWPLKNEYLIYDYNSFKFSTFDLSGKLVNEKVLNKNPLNPDSKRSIPITLDAISSHKLLIPTGGRQGSLFAIVDLFSGDVTFVGDAIDEFKEFNHQEVVQAYSKGEIPGSLLNLVMLSNSSSAIYSFQQTTGVLEKYTHGGKLMWEKELNISIQRNLFDQIAEHNRNMGVNGVRSLFIYVRAMEAYKNGVALLLNVPDDQPLTIAWVPEDESSIELVKVKGIVPDENGFMEGFTISEDRQHAYYLKRSNGTIYQFEWPL